MSDIYTKDSFLMEPILAVKQLTTKAMLNMIAKVLNALLSKQQTILHNHNRLCNNSD